MSLYDGLGVENNQSKATSWSAGFQMLKTQLEVRKATLTKAKNERVRPSSTLAPVIDFNRLRQEEEDPLEVRTSVFLGGEVLDKFFDEYDPTHPNEYEKLSKTNGREKDKQAEKEREREIEERRKRRAQRHAKQGLTGDSSLVSRDYDAEELEYEKSKQARAATKVAIAPPSILMESDNKILSSPAPPQPPPQMLFGGAGVQFAKELKGSVAHKIMSKYGFKEGKGLGKDNKGMSYALQVQKISKRGGKIISSEQIEEELQKEASEQRSVADLLNSPTKVVCLRNMVGKGEVDDELQVETSDECSKYGTVVKCLIYEMHNVQDDEAIRIFIEFDRLQSAIKALVDLNGRFFGGRSVKASFYDVDKFKAFVLNDPIP